MEKLRYSIDIHAPKKKVWETMLNDDTYRKWTEVFNPPGSVSYYKGEWKEGSSMLFLWQDENWVSGMISKIKEVRPFDYLSIQHLWEIINGKETYWPETQDARENYTFIEKDGFTQVLVELDSKEEYKDMFEEMWPEALKKLKILSESNS
ncbi:MAG: hypothetical protein ACD_3C00226G0016 [uncultured bacterium (gcode 4)]|uniref:Activator of Hsp90 ATPase homologue 1/2-like C-terminal domain-containing protein n=1 Tax=uncultured bacterium (gcode 4) TaxID=1234023 RepID=K2FZE2_9BACT|nr:MAG: hypothetical protein ACD_3C00226G0016 [uncultured bacterium (gcode 4)]